MTKEQLKLAMQLIASLDEEAKANAEAYGDWAQHLSTQIADDLIDLSFPSNQPTNEHRSSDWVVHCCPY